MDDLVKALITETVLNGLDHVWLWSEYLKNLTRLGELRGFYIRYKDILRESGLSSWDLSFRVSGPWAREFYDGVIRLVAPKYADNAASMTIEITPNEAEEEGSRGNKEQVFNWGKVTARGDDWYIHSYLLRKIIRDYLDLLKKIEDSFISYKYESGGYGVSGGPVNISVAREIDADELDVLVKHMITGRKPFRMLGFTQKIASDYYMVEAIDLHTGHPVKLEVTASWIRIYLEKGACGNIPIRLLHAVNQYVDSTAKLEIGGFV